MIFILFLNDFVHVAEKITDIVGSGKSQGDRMGSGMYWVKVSRFMKFFYFILLIIILAECTVITNKTQDALPSQSASLTQGPSPSTSTAVDTPELINAIQTTLKAPDGVTIAAVYYPPINSNSKAKAILLLHEAFQDHRSWEDFAREAQETGLAILSLDLRGHGKSGGKQTFDQSMDQDIDAALAWLQTNPEIDRHRIGIAGASVGANLALRAGGRNPDIQSLALLSPEILLWELGISEAGIDYSERPLFLVTSEEDTNSASTVQELDQTAKGNHEVHIYPGDEHGTWLLVSHPDLSLLLLDWFEKTIP